MNLYSFNPEMSCQNVLSVEDNVEPLLPNYNNNHQLVSNTNNVSAEFQHPPPIDEGRIVPQNVDSILLNDPTEVPEIPDTCFNYINDLLREEYCSSDDHFDTPNSTLEDYMSAQMSYNKSLDAVLHLGENFSANINSHIHHQCPPSDLCQTSHYSLDDYLRMLSTHINATPFPYTFQNDMQTGFVSDDFGSNFARSLPLGESSCNGAGLIPASVDLTGQGGGVSDHFNEAVSSFTMNDEEGNNGERLNKYLAPCNDVVDQIEQYGDVILCPEGRSKPGALCNGSNKTRNSGDSSKGSKKQGKKGQFVDLRGLLTRCAQCIAQVNLPEAYEMLKQIREHSSPYGDFLQRVAHYLANGLEARLEGKGLELTHANEEISPSEVLKANRVFVASVPFQIMSYYTMNKTIGKLVLVAPSIHIIDFGIHYGLQWPCIIQNLSKRPNGPPRIRITGIDFPQRGFRPSQRVEETGRCLAKYCEKYNVPFEYYPIAKKWEDVQVEELKIEKNEPLVVNCLYKTHLLFDESVEENSPRDAFLKLVRKINPDIFMHAVLNSTLSVPFFLNRFKEAMFHYSALFDILESTMVREDKERLLLESKIYGAEVLNVIACEGIDRVERPESYKQWQVRTQRAGFQQVELDHQLLKSARAMVRRSFRQEFSYDVDGYWVVQGWKGRILYAISCWKPTTCVG